jgi:flavin reductase (DIM6/NTAB) family NADH-FMN oxidoreductase RutF
MPTFDPAQIGHGAVYRLLIGTIVPRPIAWISSMNAEGQLNLAPFSFFNVACTWPPTLATSIGRRDGEKKDTWRNVEATGEYVVNIVTEAVEERMNLTSGEYGPEVDEFELTGLTPIPSQVVRPPSLAEAPVHFECRLDQIVEIGDPGKTQGLVLGRIVSITVADEIFDGTKVDPLRLNTIGRMGGMQYTRTHDIFTMIRPGMTDR